MIKKYPETMGYLIIISISLDKVDRFRGGLAINKVNTKYEWEE